MSYSLIGCTMNVQTPPSPTPTPPGSPLRQLSTNATTPNRWPKQESNHAGQPPLAQAAGAIAAHHTPPVLASIANLMMGVSLGLMAGATLSIIEHEAAGTALPESTKQQLFGSLYAFLLGVSAQLAQNLR
ncbi:hypothetical protein [Limnobacter parvus]|uniref:Uncharacterized protein n=1 Tax=Limnobacter parvus TaxID=2939690 RepID=A0ABT1XF27_9BURK|nr:hypothetical protein [Limnobacter parvus]MCR2745739.1 hypothetical protein [Limnobacter parvus]